MNLNTRALEPRHRPQDARSAPASTQPSIRAQPTTRARRTAHSAEQTRNLAAPIRRELVGRLTEAGMSTRAIAPAVGAPRETVRRDVVKLTQSGSPDPLAEEKADGRVVKLTGPGSLP